MKQYNEWHYIKTVFKRVPRKLKKRLKSRLVSQCYEVVSVKKMDPCSHTVTLKPLHETTEQVIKRILNKR